MISFSYFWQVLLEILEQLYSTIIALLYKPND